MTASALTRPDDFAAFVCTDAGAALARDIAAALQAGEDRLQAGGLSGAARLLPQADMPRLLMAELGGTSVSLAADCVAEIAERGIRLVVIGERDDLATFRALKNAGAHDYFALPAAADEVIAALTATPEAMPAATPAPAPQRDLRIGVVGCAGGVGASLLAQNLAFHAAAPKGAAVRTALFDADLFFGTQATDLDRATTPGLQEALQAPDRVDLTFLGSTMEGVSDTLAFYSHPVPFGPDTAALEAAVPPLIDTLHQAFDRVVVDLPRRLMVAQPACLQALDVLLPVLPAGYAGVGMAARLIAQVKEARPELAVLPVLAELRGDARLSGAEIEKALGIQIAVNLPRSDAGLRRAHHAAKPMITCQPRSAYARSVRRLFERVERAAAPDAGQSPQKNPFRRILA